MDTSSRYVRTEFVPSEAPIRADSSARRRKVKLSQKTLVFFKNALRKSKERLKGKYAEAYEEVSDLASKGKNIASDVDFDIAFERLQKLGVKIIEKDYKMARLECVKNAKPVNLKAKFIEKIKAKVSLLASMPSSKTVGEIAYSSFEQSRTKLAGSERNSEIERLGNVDNYIPEQSEIEKYLVGVEESPASVRPEQERENPESANLEHNVQEAEIPESEPQLEKPANTSFDVSEYLRAIEGTTIQQQPTNEEQNVETDVPVTPNNTFTEEQSVITPNPKLNETHIDVEIPTPFVAPVTPEIVVGHPSVEAPQNLATSDKILRDFNSAKEKRTHAIESLTETKKDLADLNKQLEELKARKRMLEEKVDENQKLIDDNFVSSETIDVTKFFEEKIDELIKQGFDYITVLMSCVQDFEKAFDSKMTSTQQALLMSYISNRYGSSTDSMGGRRTSL